MGQQTPSSLQTPPDRQTCTSAVSVSGSWQTGRGRSTRKCRRRSGIRSIDKEVTAVNAEAQIARASMLSCARGARHLHDIVKSSPSPFTRYARRRHFLKSERVYVNGSPQQQKPQGNLEPWTLDLGPWCFALRLGLSPLPFACPGPLLSFAPLWVLCTGGAQRICVWDLGLGLETSLAGRTVHRHHCTST